MPATQPTLAEQITAMQSQSSGRLPTNVVAAFGAEQAALDGEGPPAGVLAPGAPMPDGDLLDVHGEPTSLAAVRGDAAAVVVLYRGAWCPYCNLTLRAYQAELVPALRDRDLSLVAVSPQKPDGSLSMQEAAELTYHVLSDPGNQIARGLGVLFSPGEEARAAQLELGLDTRTVNADGTSGLPMPTVALVASDGTLRWIDVHPNYTTRTEPAAILAAADAELGD